MKIIIVELLTVIILLTCFIQNQAQTIVYEQHDIETNFDGIKTVKIIDLDTDGDLDIVGGSEITPTTASKGVAWWRNIGNNIFERFIVDSSFIHVMSVDAAFIDDDNYLDIVAASWQLNQLAWWKNGGDPTQEWTKYIIKSNFTYAHDVECGDIDNDGDRDIVATSYGLSSIVICWNDGNPRSNWKSSTLTNTFSGALGVKVIDLDKDNDFDILGTAADAGLISWWENTGSNPINWTYHNIASRFVGSSYLCVIDMDQDGLYDVIANSWISNQVAYWICNDLNNNSWTKHVLTTQLPLAAGVRAGDLDSDGDVDIVAMGKEPGEVGIYQNSDFIWTKIFLTDDFYGGESVEVLDMDGDEDLDVVAAGSSGKLVWWENKSVVGIFNESNNQMPQKFNLEQNYPNPFNPATTIKYQIPKPEFVSLKIYDVLGNEVVTLENGNKAAGNYKVHFDAHKISSGVYIYQLVAGNYSKTRKMCIIK